MRIFLYKSLLVFFLVLILFKLTVGSLIGSYEKKINLAFSKENLINIQNKLRDEMNSGLKKDRILNPEDAALIGKFLDKITLEIKENK